MRPLTLYHVSFERTIKMVFVGACIIFFASYAYFQARNLILGPSIDLHGELGIIQNERSVTVAGNARNVVVLSLNGREIHTDEQGNFEQALVLENGYTIMSLEAEDRFGRNTMITRTFVYKPKT